MKVAYVFAGERKNKNRKKAGADFSDTQLYGLNHLKNFGISAEYKEWSDSFFGKIFGRFLGFNLRQAFMYFKIGGYDLVFGSSAINMIFFKKLFHSKKKFVMLNISFTRLWRANKEKPLKGRFIRWLAGGLDGVVCLSEEQKQFCLREFPEMSDKIFHTPFGVDEVFHKFNNAERANFILSAGRDNGRDYKTVFEVAEKMPEEKFEIVCSPRNLRGLPKNPPENLKISFDIDKKELEKKYETAKLLLLATHPDSHEDGADCSGQTVLLEAMASGLPVIATNRKCLSDYITPGVTAESVSPYDVGEIVRKIKHLGNKKTRGAMALAARKSVEQSFTSFCFASRLAEIFRTVSKSQ